MKDQEEGTDTSNPADGSTPGPSVWGQLARDVGLLATVGIQLVVSTFIGLGFGLLLDRAFSTAPLFMLIFLLVGIIAGFVNLFRVARRFGR